MENPGTKRAYELFGHGQPPKDTRDRLLYCAMDLFFTYGFHAVGIDRIIADVGVTKTTFYNHFDSKDHLIIEVIRLSEQWESEVARRRLFESSQGDPRLLILGYFDLLDEYFNGEDFKGCQFLNACAEFPSPDSAIHREAAKHYINSEDMFRTAAERLSARNPEELARQLTILVEGALTRRLVTGDDGAALAARHIAERMLDDACAGDEGTPHPS